MLPVELSGLKWSVISVWRSSTWLVAPYGGAQLHLSVHSYSWFLTISPSTTAPRDPRQALQSWPVLAQAERGWLSNALGVVLLNLPAAPCSECPFSPFLPSPWSRAGLWRSPLWELFVSPASLHQAVGCTFSPGFWSRASKSRAIITN